MNVFSILISQSNFQFPCLDNFFSICLINVHVVHPYSSLHTRAAWKKLRFILADKSDFHMTDNQSIAVHAIASRVFMSFSVDETLLPRYVNYMCALARSW